MSGSLNRVMLIGHLGADPEQKTYDDKTVVTFTVATNERWTDKGGKSTSSGTASRPGASSGSAAPRT